MPSAISVRLSMSQGLRVSEFQGFLWWWLCFCCSGCGGGVLVAFVVLVVVVLFALILVTVVASCKYMQKISWCLENWSTFYFKSSEHLPRVSGKYRAHIKKVTWKYQKKSLKYFIFWQWISENEIHWKKRKRVAFPLWPHLKVDWLAWQVSAIPTPSLS